jgi:hypothetical protein
VTQMGYVRSSVIEGTDRRCMAPKRERDSNHRLRRRLRVVGGLKGERLHAMRQV